MIKVMNIISDTNIGGAGRVLLNYVKYYNRDEFDVSVAVPRGSALVPRLKALGVRTLELDIDGDRSFDRAAVPVLKQAIDKEMPDIVHTHGSLSGRIAARRSGRHVIYTRHCAFPVKSYMKHGPGNWLNRCLNLHYADRVIAVGDAAKESLVESGIPVKYIDVMMNGCEKLPEATPDERLRYRSKWGISEDDFVIGILARIEIYKGHDDILDAIKILISQGEKIRFLVAGSGDYEQQLRKRAEKELPPGTVIFTGFIDNVAEVISAMDVQINASYESETSSLSVIEGMSAGIPAIVSDCGGNPLLIDDGVNGYIFKMRDSESLAGCIKRLMNDRDLLERMSRDAVKIYEERFTVKSFADKVEAVYRKVTGGRNND